MPFGNRNLSVLIRHRGLKCKVLEGMQLFRIYTVYFFQVYLLGLRTATQFVNKHMAKRSSCSISSPQCRCAQPLQYLKETIECSSLKHHFQQHTDGKTFQKVADFLRMYSLEKCFLGCLLSPYIRIFLNFQKIDLHEPHVG